MKFLVDENVPFGQELFGSLGDVTMVAGREVTVDFPGLDQYDVLAIRSVTHVTHELVERAARLRVVATATIGTDHIDLEGVVEANRRRRTPVAVLSAPGSNAESVADHVWFALTHLARTRGEPLHGRSMGVIGFGNCGSRVARRARGFGLAVLAHDPPLEKKGVGFASCVLEDALAADFVTLHVPLTRAGESRWPTFHMISAEQIGRMRPRAWLVNCSRGGVVDSPALIEALTRRVIRGAVLDVYEGEPAPEEGLLALPALTTPHVAGYAVEAKRRGATVIYEQTCRVLGIKPRDTRDLLYRGFQPPRDVQVEFDGPGGGSVEDAADRAVTALLGRVYDIQATSDALKATVRAPQRGQLFDRMRKDYEKDYGRHELSAYRVALDSGLDLALDQAIRRRLAGFGIEVTDDQPHYVLCAS